ncbi:hypothetical protein OPIT5_00215 (plasmid) [Opitutaceae bacterium TAV5]|nr:hypothetical protein OPIT5_00215 [Opitutaceae bacterium TAV5]
MPAGRVAYIVFKDVPAGEAYQLARGINGDALLTDTSEEGTNDQINGQVTYLGSDTGVVDVYVYLAAF